MTGHTHETEHQDQAATAAWFRSLDLVVWAAVAVIAVLALEWLGGFLVRERLARSFRQYLDRADELRNRGA